MHHYTMLLLPELRQQQQPLTWQAAMLHLPSTLANSFTVFMCNAAVLGAYAYWGPKAGAKVFQLPPEGADLKFGAVTVATGVVGTVLGGLALDRVGSTMRNALAICCISNVLG